MKYCQILIIDKILVIVQKILKNPIFYHRVDLHLTLIMLKIFSLLNRNQSNKISLTTNPNILLSISIIDMALLVLWKITMKYISSYNILNQTSVNIRRLYSFVTSEVSRVKIWRLFFDWSIRTSRFANSDAKYFRSASASSNALSRSSRSFFSCCWRISNSCLSQIRWAFSLKIII